MKIMITIVILSMFAPVMAASLPNPALTPGVSRGLAVSKVCGTKWGKDSRAVTAAMKAQVYHSYKMKNHQGDCARSSRGCEIDHLISRELGGADDLRNLWPQSYGGAWNAVMKDRLENKLHAMVCATPATITLQQAQEEIKTDWVKSYLSRIGEPK